MNLFLDTNILLDFLAKREPWGIEASKIFSVVPKYKISLFTSSISISNCLFILSARHRHNMPQTHEILYKFLKSIDVLPTNKTTFQQAFKSEFSDKEDAIQYFSALEHGNIDYIITRDKKDFIKSEIPVLTLKEFIKKHLK